MLVMMTDPTSATYHTGDVRDALGNTLSFNVSVRNGGPLLSIYATHGEGQHKGVILTLPITATQDIREILEYVEAKSEQLNEEYRSRAQPT
jgi:hypothetical protein